MNNNVFIILIIVAIVVKSVMLVSADMTSTNYRIPTTVMSGGGSLMDSNSYRLNGTIGQATPLMDPLDPSFSDTYDLYPGFWYTLVASIPPNDCPGDFEPDGDVDESDLAIFAADFGRTNCNTLPVCKGDFDNDDDVDGSDLAVFAADFGKTDCPVP